MRFLRSLPHSMAAAVLTTAAILCGVDAAAGEPDWGQVADSVKPQALKKHIETLASFGSRVPGYPGHDQALAYIRQEFERLGYTDIEEEDFPVTVPVDEGSSLEILGSGERFTLHALWPNLVRTSQLPRDGVTTQAVFCKSGSWEDLSGNTIKDAIVFMDFNSDANWLNAAMLGARAIVFIEPERTVRRQAEAKLPNVPLNMPKFWIAKSDFRKLSHSGMGMQVRLRCRMRWREIRARNLLVRTKRVESEEVEKPICIQAYYDSMSIVPALAPGAEAACGVAAMLEIARALKARPPERGVLFLATSGHFLANSGMGAFVQKHSRKRKPFMEQIPKRETIHPDLMLCLDLSSRNETLGITFEDGIHGVRQPDTYRQRFRRHADEFRAYAEKLATPLGRSQDDLCLDLIFPGGAWRPFLPESISLDSTIALIAATPALTFATVQDPRLALDTPLDGPADVNLPNLTLQTRYLVCATLMALDDPKLLKRPKMQEDFLAVFRGRLVTFDPSKSFMPDQPVSGGIGRFRLGLQFAPTGGTASHLGVRTEALALADDDGRFEILISSAKEAHVEGYDLDPDTGNIVKALDLGLEGTSQFPTEFVVDKAIVERKAIVLFECAATDLYDLVDPRYLISMDKLSLFDPGNAEPFAYGYTLNVPAPTSRSSEAFPYASVFTKPETRVKFGISSDILGQRMLFLNAPSADTKKESEGLGYEVDQLRLIENSSFQVLRDMYYLDEQRIRVVKEYGIENHRLERLHAAGGEALGLAREAMSERRWDRFAKQARRGLGIESRAYPDVRATADDVVKGVVFYMALLIPFAFFCERLFFAFPDLKRRLFAFVGFFVLVYVVLRLVHPAFRIVETSEVILLGLIILALCTIVVAISAGRFEAQMRTLKQRRGKVHYTDVSRTSATATAFSLGVSNMRRRKVRTFLTCTAIVLLMFTVLSFTSVKTYLRPQKLPRPNAPAYQGALIRDRTWVPMKFLALEHLASEFEDVGLLARRSWLTPKAISEAFTRLSILLRPVVDGNVGPERIRAFGLVGFDAAEVDVSGVHAALATGRWFRAGEREVCILPDTIADALNIRARDVGKVRLHLLGMRPLVIGIVESAAYNEFKDLDNERLTPLDFAMLSRDQLVRTRGAAGDVSAVEGRAPLESLQHIDIESIVLMPYETVLDLGGALQSVAVKFKDGATGQHVERLLDRLAVTVFVGEGDRTMVYSSLAGSGIGGMSNILIPVLIAALMILNTMSGSVHERLREIGTYSAVGLAPSHIGALFLAEACVYAILGGIAGYVLGQVVTKVLFEIARHVNPDKTFPLSLNYSSLAAVVASLIVMVTVVASTLYPARMAARMAVPDVTRKWVLPDPEGDQWHFDFPFTVSGKEVKGLYAFFRYYFASFEEQSIGRFYTSSTELSRFEESGQQGYCLAMRVWLAPYDLGVSQDVELRAVPAGDFGTYLIKLRINRLSGQSTTWVRINRGFLDELRKQFLLWRTISPEMKTEYTAEAQDLFTKTQEETRA